MIHCDIKPENILLNIKDPTEESKESLMYKTDFEVKLCDFGMI